MAPLLIDDRTDWALDVPPSELGDPPPPRLSPIRLISALVLVAGALAAVIVVALAPGRAAIAPADAAAGAPVFSPYVDVTLTPSYAFQDPTANPVGDVALGFVTAAREPAANCAPSWGGAYTMSQAESALDLDRRIAQVTTQGGTPVVSFGGQANTELALACADTGALTRAYASVLDRYGVSTADFDIEGAALADTAANDRRAQAVAALQRSRRAAKRPLSVWLTLPAGTDGLTVQGQAAIASMLRAGVRLAGVNAMTMDFDPASVRGLTMLKAVQRSLTATHDQLGSLTRRAGLSLDDRALWGRLGATVMIGRNDVPGQVFTLADARGLVTFAAEHDLRRVSAWSLNRDAQCGAVFARVAVLSNTCSGVRQAPLAFTDILMGLPGTATADAATLHQAAIPQVAEPPADDPATSPFPIWRAAAAYPAAFKVVWHGDVYQAKWFSQNQAPDSPVSAAAQTPWLLLGPVREDDPPMRMTMTTGLDHPRWTAGATYRAGDRVIYRGLPFEARWYVQGIVPDTEIPAGPDAPWKQLFSARGEPGQPGGGA